MCHSDQSWRMEKSISYDISSGISVGDCWGYVGTLFILLLTMLVSAKTHATVVAVTLPFIIIFIQSFLGEFPNLTDVLGLLPDQFLQIPSVPILMTMYPILCVVLLPIMYHVYHRTEIK